MKEKIMSMLFEKSGKEASDHKIEYENSIYKDAEVKKYAGYLERKTGILDLIFKKNSIPICGKVRIEEFDERSEIPGEDKVEIALLADSIKKHGMMLPITVFRTEEKKYRIIDGKKRFSAVKLLKREEIYSLTLPCSERVGEVLRIKGAWGEGLLDYGRKAGGRLLAAELDRELLKCTSLLTDRKIGALIDIASLSEGEAGILRQISLEKLLCEIAAIRDPRFRDYVIITFAEFFKDFEGDMHKVIANKNKRYTQSDKMIFKDIRIVFNSIDGSLNKLRRSGIRVNAEKYENDSEYTYTITVKKP